MITLQNILYLLIACSSLNTSDSDSMSVDDYKDKHHGSMRRWEPGAGNDPGVGRAYPHSPAPEVGRQSWGWQCGPSSAWVQWGDGLELGLGMRHQCGCMSHWGQGSAWAANGAGAGMELLGPGRGASKQWK